MRRLLCQYSAHVEQLSVLPICSEHKVVSSGTCNGCSTLTVALASIPAGALLKVCGQLSAGGGEFRKT